MNFRKYVFGLAISLIGFAVVATPVSFNVATFGVELSSASAGGHKEKKAKKEKKEKGEKASKRMNEKMKGVGKKGKGKGMEKGKRK